LVILVVEKAAVAVLVAMMMEKAAGEVATAVRSSAISREHRRGTCAQIDWPVGGESSPEVTRARRVGITDANRERSRRQ